MKYFLKAFYIALSYYYFLHPHSAQAQACRCNEYSELRNKYENSEDSYEPYIKKLQALNSKICTAKAEEWMAAEYLSTNNFDTAELHLQKAEQVYKQTGCGDSLLLFVYKTWAQLYYTKGDFAKAQEKSLLMLVSAENSGNYFEMANGNTMIAQLLNQTGQSGKGILYTRRAVAFVDKIRDPVKKLEIYFKISKRFLWHYQDNKTVSSLDSSEFFSRKQLALAKETGNRNSMAIAYSNLQGVAWERKDLSKAIQLLDSSFLYINKKNHESLGTNYFDKADILLELKDYKQAIRLADSALFYRKLTGNPAYIAECYSLLSRINIADGKYKAAYEYNESARSITDSIRNEEKTKAVTELERKYTQATNEKKIHELAQQKRIYVLLAAAGLFALVGLVFFIRQQSLKNKQKILETEQRLNRARMNPHFFFNALSSLQSYALEGNDGKSIASNLSKFSHIMRETLESTYKEYVTVEQEADFLKEYLELQKIRFPEKFTYNIYSGTVEADETLIPSMILQPSVENSIEHGFKGINYPGELTIIFDKKEKDLLISIIDNGKGLATTAKESNEHISRASQIIKDRIYLLNVKLKTKASFSIDNNKNDKGVTVLIKLPLLYKQDLKV